MKFINTRISTALILTILFINYGYTQAFTQQDIKQAIDNTLITKTGERKITIITKVLKKIGSIQLSNPSKKKRDLLELIKFELENTLNTLILDQYEKKKGVYVQNENTFIKEIVEHTNILRLKRGLGVVRLQHLLTTSANIHAEDMLFYDYFDHTSPLGIGYIHRTDAVGYTFESIAENIAQGFTSGKELIKALEVSQIHLSNMIHPDIEEIGVGISSEERYISILYASPRTER